MTEKPARPKSIVEQYRERVEKQRLAQEITFDLVVGKGIEYKDHLTQKATNYNMPSQQQPIYFIGNAAPPSLGGKKNNFTASQ